MGSVFSPYYLRERRAGGGVAGDHCALNVVHYGRRAGRWAMTERGEALIRREPAAFTIGPSRVHWQGDALRFDIDEVTVPIPRRVAGSVLLHPGAPTDTTLTLDVDGRHRWRPIAPRSRIEVNLEKPGLTWSGHAYFDSNEGDEPLEHAFTYWNWSRASSGDDSAILYDVARRDGTRRSIALRIDRHGAAEPLIPPRESDLPPTRIWRMPRRTRTDDGAPARVAKTLEDTPFYSRSILRTRLLGHETVAMHESLSLTRFASAIVQRMLPYRMPRKVR